MSQQNPPQGQPPQGQPPQYQGPPGHPPPPGHPQYYGPPGNPPPPGQYYPPRNPPPPPGYGGPSYVQPGLPHLPYEFSPKENQTIGRTATWAKAVAILFFVQVVFSAIDVNVIGAAIDLAIGLAFWKGASALRMVVETHGADVTHMMEGLQQLSSAFTVRLVIVGIAAVILVLVGGGALTMVL